VKPATRSNFFVSAADLLTTGGVSALTLAAICKRTAVTSGSFYHHFGSWNGFVDCFLEDWESSWTHRLIAVSNQAPDARARFDALMRLAVEVPHAAESSIRAWASSNRAVAAAQERVDARRIFHLRELLTQFVEDEREAERLAMFAFSTFVGAELLHQRMTPTSFAEVLDDVRLHVLAVADKHVIGRAPPA
jgi:AcrR family transcriptional regulator